MTPQEMVKEFHDVYRVAGADLPTPMSVSLRDLRLKLIAEEFEELVAASGFEFRAVIRDGSQEIELAHVEGSQQNLVEMADGLGDIVYVCYGMAIAMGIDLDKVIEEIHESNMSKLGEDGEPIINGITNSVIDQRFPKGKVLKGPNYRKPDIAKVIGVVS